MKSSQLSLCQIEAVLNSRPLVPQSTQDDTCLQPLTPGHFLVGQSLTTLPDIDHSQCKGLLRRWNLPKYGPGLLEKKVHGIHHYSQQVHQVDQTSAKLSRG